MEDIFLGDHHGEDFQQHSTHGGVESCEVDCEQSDNFMQILDLKNGHRSGYDWWKRGTRHGTRAAQSEGRTFKQLLFFCSFVPLVQPS